MGPAKSHHRPCEFPSTPPTNALRTRAFHEFPATSILSDLPQIGRAFPNAPSWHTACICRCNGTKHETSRILPSVSHPVSPLARVASRRVNPGLWRTGRIEPATAPSLHDYRDGRAGCGVRAARRNAGVHRGGRQLVGRGGDLERRWNSRRKFRRRNDRGGRRLHGSSESSIARFGLYTSRQRGRHGLRPPQPDE